MISRLEFFWWALTFLLLELSRGTTIVAEIGQAVVDTKLDAIWELILADMTRDQIHDLTVNNLTVIYVSEHIFKKKIN